MAEIFPRDVLAYQNKQDDLKFMRLWENRPKIIHWRPIRIVIPNLFIYFDFVAPAVAEKIENVAAAMSAIHSYVDVVRGFGFFFFCN